MQSSLSVVQEETLAHAREPERVLPYEIGGSFQLEYRFAQVVQLLGNDGLRIADTPIVEIGSHLFGEEIQQKLRIEASYLLLQFLGEIQLDLARDAAHSPSLNLISIMDALAGSTAVSGRFASPHRQLGAIAGG
ncbi:hypothetical protein [Xanthomonas euvesicatoria]|uniref:hypothetical protein n=1 Tax=Xanthomonas euvesicatoria TaxID=456327 RepID=UPI003D2F97E0